MGKKLKADLINSGSVTNALHERLCRRGSGHIKGDNQPLPHPGGCGHGYDFRKMGGHTSSVTPSLIVRYIPDSRPRVRVESDRA